MRLAIINVAFSFVWFGSGNVWNLLGKFKVETELRVDVLLKKIYSSEAGKVYTAALKQGTFFRSAQVLFPNKTSVLINGGRDMNDPEGLRNKLEKISVETPWMLAFREVMYRQTRYSNLEAPSRKLKLTDLYPKLSEEEKVALYTYDLMNYQCQKDGHTYLLLQNLKQYSYNYQRNVLNIDDTNRIKSVEVIRSLKFLIENRIVHKEGENEDQKLYLMKFWIYERGVCTSLSSLLTADPLVVDIDLHHSRFQRIHADGEQMKAAELILKNPVVMISGRGGTGKTEVVSSVLKAFEEKLPGCENRSKSSKDLEDSPVGPVLYCAPTGKAASVIKSRVGSTAFTIHQILGSYMSYKKGNKKNDWRFSGVQIVAVDESSMVSTELLYWLLLYLLQGARLRKIIFLGDHLQLPSVEPGNVMEDLYNVFLPRGLAVDLLTNHRSQGSIIFENAQLISEQKMPVIDPGQGFSLIIPDGENTLRTIPMDIRSNVQILEKKEDADLYETLLKHHRENYHIEDDEKSQFISFTNNVCDTINQLACEIYNHHPAYVEKKRFVKSFEIGDKIICTKNGDVTVLVPDMEKADGGLKRVTERLMNGNLYKIRGKEGEHHVFEELVRDGDVIKASLEELKEKTRISHAWAMTIHKFQGSEAETVLYFLSGSKYENWQHVYTAVTRGRKHVIIVGRFKDFQHAINREKNVRQTGLQKKVELVFPEKESENYTILREINDDNTPTEDGTHSRVRKRPRTIIESPSKRMKMESSSVESFTEVFTDGAIVKPWAGYGVYWGPGHGLNTGQRVRGEKQTKNLGEIQAAIMAVTQARDRGIKNLRIITVNKNVVLSMTELREEGRQLEGNWMNKWKKEGWKKSNKKKVENKEALQTLDMLLDGDVNVEWKYEKKSLHLEGSKQAFKLAQKGARIGVEEDGALSERSHLVNKDSVDAGQAAVEALRELERCAQSVREDLDTGTGALLARIEHCQESLPRL